MTSVRECFDIISHEYKHEYQADSVSLFTRTCAVIPGTSTRSHPLQSVRFTAGSLFAVSHN